ncbi:MAG: sigma-70 family RNA polymerase sigma factor [Sedimentisphaerales bacterium]|nr:sigma-70 family RNA polymerase sigma factor [Sedimentisphaerales bacterium]
MTLNKTNSIEQNFDSAHPINKLREHNLKERSERTLDSLVRRLRAGDRTAATELVDIYYKQIYLFMRRLGHNRQVSEDLTQESFINAWYHIGQLRDGKALNGWLYRIAGNVSKLYWRRNKRRNPAEIESYDATEYAKAGLDIAEHNEQTEQIKKAVARLPIKLRQTIILHYMQQLTIAEAADAIGIREGTFKSRLNRALTILRKQVT